MSLRVIWQYMPYDPQCHELFAIYGPVRHVNMLFLDQAVKRVGLKTGRRKTGRANFDIFLDITFVLLELCFKFKLICKVETNI